MITVACLALIAEQPELFLAFFIYTEVVSLFSHTDHICNFIFMGLDRLVAPSPPFLN
jgi:hypothetical protein